jgi:chemotaxis protein MotB
MRTYRHADSEGEIWPAYTDILMVTCLTLILLAVTMSLVRNDDHISKERERRKEIFSARFNQALGQEIKQGLVKLYSPVGESQTITFSDQLLFEKGDAELRRENGRASLDKVTKLFKQVSNPPLFSSISVKGHTDEDPVQTVEFPSNWHLSSARATSVVYFFTKAGIQPERLTAMGFAEFNPQTPEGEVIKEKARKRRVEIELRYPDAWIDQQGKWK